MGRKGATVLGLFDEKNVVPKKIPDAVLINSAYKLGIPPLAAGVRAFGIKKAAVDKHPDRYAQLVKTGMMVFADPDYKAAVIKAKAPWEMISPGGEKECRAYVDNITKLGQEYAKLLKG